MIRDPRRRGRALAALYATIEPRLYADLDEAGVLPPRADAAAASRVRAEWACFALYACVRGLIAAGGFNRESGDAVEALHEAALESWREREPGDEAARRERMAERYAEYGTIGQEGGASGAGSVGARLGAACARHVAGDSADRALGDLLGDLHESIALGAADQVRLGE
jgi:hypothetical protein